MPLVYKLMLGRDCVPERDRVPSLQCFGYPLEQEHGLLLRLVTSVIFLPISEINSTAFSFHAPSVSIAIGANWWVFASSWYFAVLLSAARFAAADAVVAVSAMYELA